MKPLTKAAITRLTWLGLLAVLLMPIADIYRVVRSERVNTRLSFRMDGTDHELIAALPAGTYQFHFEGVPKVSTVVGSSPQPELPAHITTSITMQNSGDTILLPEGREYRTFSIPRKYSFRPCRIRVTIVRERPCDIYMNIGPGF